MAKPEEYERFFEQKRLTLDLVGLSDAQKQHGSIFLGGSSAEYVRPDDRYSYENIATILFRWGDPKMDDMFTNTIEHSVPPSPEILPFGLTTLVGNRLYILTLQFTDFKPMQRYASPDFYTILPYDENLAQIEIADVFDKPPVVRPEILGKIANRYVAFGMSIDLPPNFGS